MAGGAVRNGDDAMGTRLILREVCRSWGLGVKDKMLEELRLSVGIVLSGVEVVPRFRVMTPEGDWTVFVPLPDDMAERQRRMQLLYGFMAWKGATGFIMASELVEPDCVIVGGVSRNEVLMAARPVLRKPLTVGPIEWLGPEMMGDEVVALLPRGQVSLDPETVAALARSFGPGGDLEAQRTVQ